MGTDGMRLGFQWEDEFADRMGLEKVKGSGNKWYWQGDIEGMKVVFSLKHTSAMSFSLEGDDWDEIERIAVSSGPDVIPCMAIRMSGRLAVRELIVWGMEDVRRAFQEERKMSIESKAEAKRRMAAQPQLFRDA